jgi:transketolase
MKRIVNDMKIHDSQRGHFAHALWQEMSSNPDIYLVTADMGYRMLDAIRTDHPDRFINTGASEQAAMGIAVGLAIEGKIPFVYSITTFILYRPFEFIRNYVNHECIPVRIVGGGRDDDYARDGISHQALEVRQVMDLFPNIRAYWPNRKDDIPAIVREMVISPSPAFISLRR